MSLFQIAGTAFSAAVVGALVWGAFVGKARLRNAAPWILVWSAAGLCIAWPEVTAILARGLGVERGADLVSYIAILGALAGFFAVWLRVRQLDRSITLLVRELALHEAAPSEVAGPRSSPGPPERGG